MQKYKSNDGESTVYIAEEHGNMITLSDGTKVMKDYFSKLFSPVQSQEIDPNAFLNTTPATGIHKLIETQEQLIKMKNELNPAANPNYVDPDAFFNSAIAINPNDINTFLNTDTSNAIPVPPSQEATIREFSGPDIDDMPGMNSKMKEEYLKANAKIAPRLSNDDLSKFKQIDENDETILDNFIKKEEQRTGKSMNKELAKQAHEAFLKEQELVDPALEKYEDKYEDVEEEDSIVEEETAYVAPVVKKAKPKKATMDDFFDQIERTYDIKINLEIEDKIGDIEFSKMMAKHMKSDIIEYYTKSIFQNVLSDIGGLEKKIYDQLHEIIYGESKPDVLSMATAIAQQVVGLDLVSEKEAKLQLIKDTGTMALSVSETPTKFIYPLTKSNEEHDEIIEEYEEHSTPDESEIILNEEDD